MEDISAQYVADSFVKQYYAVLNKCPENVYKFYKESSLLSWPGPDGVITPVTTSSGINDKIVSSDYTKWFVEIETVDAQDSLERGIVVAVTGFLTGKEDNAKKNFFQTFFLAKQDNGFFVLNDILHIFDDYIKDKAAAHFTQNSVPPYTTDHTASSKTEDAVENGNFEEVVDISVSSDIAATVATSTSSVDSLENVGSISEPASDTKGDVQETDQLASSSMKNAVENGNVEEAVDLSVSDDAAVTVAASTSYVDPQENSCSIPELDYDVKDDFASVDTKDTVEDGNSKEEVDSSVSQDASVTVAAQKITYASVVAKGRARTSSSTARVPPNADNRAVSPPPLKVSASPNTDNEAAAPQTAKVSASVVAGASKISPQPNNAYPKLREHSNASSNTTGHAEAATTGIYIGRLPIDIDKQGILKVVTKFGPVRKNLESIQIRRHEDGFCCGFVEFESADSARRAVEARRVNFSEKESYISYKRSSYRGDDGAGRSLSTGGFRSRKTRENGQVSDNKRSYNKEGSSDIKGQA
ncbi:Nuclear transport factor 2 [Handroanthus impetiginosus]|uniref:Nuclear transport factor 2 n=1 Tax=Handroanthus impetiginosus TaxID=429701 RepID=A0A2G9HS34_9LAMI|nr:Nuclear transport factor 2 [Handroanthus impetiginosus]